MWAYDSGGNQWNQMAVPDLELTLEAVGGRSATDFYAVGDLGAILHYDGSRWFPVRTGTTTDFASIAVDGQRVLVGAADFTVYELLPGGFGDRWAPALAHQVAVVGSDVYILAGNELRRWQGLGFQNMSLSGEGPLISAGDTVLVSLANNTLRTFDGSPTFVATIGQVALSLWAESDTQMFLGANDAVIEVNSGVQTAHAISGAGDLELVSSGGGAAYAANSSGQIYSNRSGSWALDFSAGSLLSALWCSDTGVVFAAGESGSMWSFDGSDWMPMAVDTEQRILGVHGSSATDVFAVTATTLHHYDGERWSPVETGGLGAESLFATSNYVYFISPGVFRRLSRPTPWN
jgi:hypothetical protein